MLCGELFGFYSERAVAAGCGSSFYVMGDGSEAELTFVDGDPSGSGYWWGDKVLVGSVVRFSREGRVDRFRSSDG